MYIYTHTYRHICTQTYIHTYICTLVIYIYIIYQTLFSPVLWLYYIYNHTYYIWLYINNHINIIYSINHIYDYTDI